MTRPSRSEVQERNRRTVLAAARDEFLREGYLATSVASVARAAGFTTGIVYSSFGSKAGLALEVVDEIQAAQIADLASRLRGAGTLDDQLARLRSWAVRATSSGWVRFELELLLDTLGDEKIAAAQVLRQEAAVTQAAAVIRSLVPAGSLDDATAEVLAEAAVDYAIGIGIRHVSNPAASPDRFLTLMAPVLGALGRQ